MDAKKPSARSQTKSSAARSKAGEAAGASAPARRTAAPKARAATPANGLALLERAFAGTFPPTLYIEGPDEALKAAFLSEYRRAWAAAVPESPAARVLWPGEDDVDTVLGAWQGVSLFTPRELTIVMGIEVLARSEKRAGALAAGLGRPGGESRLVLVEAAAEKARKTLDPVRAACTARWEALAVDSRELGVWGERRLSSESIAIEPGALEALLGVCEGESASYFSELAKLAGWAGPGGRVTATDVLAISRPVVGSDLPEYLLAVASGDAKVAATRLGRLIAARESEGELMFALANLVGGALGGWARWRDLSAVLGRRRTPRELAHALDAVYRAEAAWKTGRADALAALEQATRVVAAG
jgi:DNA polymerase III delta subunit